MRKLFLLAIISLFTLVTAKSQSPGLMYGMTFTSYTNNATIFDYDPTTGKDTIAAYFSSQTGDHPYGALLQAFNGKLYGLTYTNPAQGTLFFYNLATGKDSVGISFTGLNGSTPYGSLIQARDSLLYGLTSLGGASGDGVLFSYNTITGKDSTRFSFNGTDGSTPQGTLFQASDSMLYGMTYSGGTNNEGVLFKFNPKTNQETVLVNFNGTNGAHPIYNSLVQDTNGLLYGMTTSGGTGGVGVLFSYNITTGKDSVCYNFSYGIGDVPYGALIHDTNGILYGMTSYGGALYYGIIFRFDPVSGKDSVLFNFTSPSGNSPYGDLLFGSNGLLYGMTHVGGVYNEGTVFSYNLNNSKDSVLFNFNDTIGEYSFGSPIQVMSVKLSGNDTVRCYGDSTAWAKVTARGAKMPVTYLWSNGSTSDSIGNLKAGKYNCIIKDSRGITFTDTVRIYQPGPFMPAPSVSNNCYGDSVGIARGFVSGGTPPFQYIWGNGATTDSIIGLKPGTYSCTVTDAHGCATTVNCTITQAQPLKIDSVVSTPATWPGYNNGVVKVYVSGGIPAGDSIYQYYQYYYSWSPGSDSISLSDSLIIHGLSPGVTYINVSNACGLVQDSLSVPMGVTSLISPADAVIIYPVPSSGIFTVDMHGTGFERIIIADVFGRIVYQGMLHPEQNAALVTIDLGAQTDGVYIVQLISKEGIEMRRIIISR